MQPIFYRSANNYDMDEVSLETGLECKDPSLAQQQFKDEADINTIVERFHLTGTVPQLTSVPADQDYEGIFDFQSAMHTVIEAQRQFMTMPAKIRARFANDPQQFHDFFADPENYDEAVKLGMVDKNTRGVKIPPAAQPQQTETTNGDAPGSNQASAGNPQKQAPQAGT